MLKRIGRRFYAAKYVYSIHLHGVSPWFMHEKPARVTWKRGSKKHKKGQTEVRMPVRAPGAHINNGSLKIEETFELGVTLYAVENRNLLSARTNTATRVSSSGKQQNEGNRTLWHKRAQARHYGGWR